MSGGVLLQAVVSGLSIGAVYALVALGFTLVWSLTADGGPHERRACAAD
jgi:hypothetical protein